MSEYCYKPNGELQGDSKPMPTKNEGSMAPDSYGADLSPDATNRMGSIRGTSKSDKPGHTV